jgi:hypothetical protein
MVYRHSISPIQKAKRGRERALYMQNVCKKKGFKRKSSETLLFSSRGGQTRTGDPLLPKHKRMIIVIF